MFYIVTSYFVIFTYTDEIIISKKNYQHDLHNAKVRSLSLQSTNILFYFRSPII